MRTLREIKHEIEMVDRELAKYLITASDADQQMAILDRRRSRLETEYQEALLTENV